MATPGSQKVQRTRRRAILQEGGGGDNGGGGEVVEHLKLEGTPSNMSGDYNHEYYISDNLHGTITSGSQNFFSHTFVADDDYNIYLYHSDDNSLVEIVAYNTTEGYWEAMVSVDNAQTINGLQDGDTFTSTSDLQLTNSTGVEHVTKSGRYSPNPDNVFNDANTNTVMTYVEVT